MSDNPINNLVISTKEELENYRTKLHAEVAAKNPGREFEILFGDIRENKGSFVQIWLDGKGPLL